MLKISEQQRARMRQGIEVREKRALAAHLAGCFPLLSVLSDPEAAAPIVDLGVERARAHRFRSRGQVRLWLELMCLLGWRFDEDPLLPDALRSASATRCDAPPELAVALYSEASAHLTAYAGPDGEAEEAARARVASALVDGAGALPTDCAAFLLQAHPDKVEALGQAAVDTMISREAERAGAIGLDTSSGAVLCALLALFHGVGFDSDPLRPWIAASLSGSEGDDPEARAAALGAALRADLNRVAT